MTNNPSPELKYGDRVITPNGKGSVREVLADGRVVCRLEDVPRIQTFQAEEVVRA